MEFKTKSYVLKKAGLLKKVALAVSRSTTQFHNTNPSLLEGFESLNFVCFFHVEPCFNF